MSYKHGAGSEMGIVEHYVSHPREVVDAYYASGIWNNDTVADWVQSWAQTAPQKVAVQELTGAAVTYNELNRKSICFASALWELGIRKGEVVAIQLPSSIEFMIAYLGVTRIGGVLATMHVPYREGELEPLLRFAEARAVICGPADGARYGGPAMMNRLKHQIPSLEHVILARGADGGETASMSDMIDAGGFRQVPDTATASDPVLLCFTSGTSAAPKGVLRSCETLTADARLYVDTIGLTGDDRSMIAPPFTHVFGLLCANNALYTGGTIIPLEQFVPSVYAEMLEATRPSVVYSAPAHLAATLKAGVLEGRDLFSVRQVVLGGAICPPKVAAAFEACLPNGRVGNLFGMTEVLLVTQTPMDAGPDVRHATVGRPIREVEARIMTGNDDDDEGELQLRGATIMAGYMKNETANRAAFTADRWFRTGDLAVWDEGGNIVITGRVKDLINRGGIKVNPTDIENAIAAHPSVVLAAIVPMPDEVLGERICAFVTLVPGASLDLADITEFISARGVAKMRWPERLVVIDEMPLTPTRKIIKGVLQERLNQENSGPGLS